MSLSAFKEKVMSEAARQAEGIADANALALQEERSRASKELREMEEAVVTAAEKEAQQQTRSIHQQAQLQGRSLVLTAKQEELARTKEAFLSSLMSLSDAEKKNLHNALLQLVPKETGKVVPEKDGNGFIFRAEGVEMNLTLSYLVDHVFWKYRSELAKELFS